MLDFNEEIKKFKPCLEVDQIERAIYEEDLSDISEILEQLMEKKKKKKK